MKLTWYSHTDAASVRSLLLDVHDEVYAGTGEFNSRERFSYFVDLWSGRPDWRCAFGWEDGAPVGYAYGSRFKPGGWWKGSARPQGVRGLIFALSELMVLPQWRGTGRARAIHDALIHSAGADYVTLLVDAAHARVQALYERWATCNATKPSPPRTLRCMR